ncbi:Ribonuclease H-like domain [Phytophthora cactorum]|nr:Ribonuclease H-like domain [Phytophthora cactorum]
MPSSKTNLDDPAVGIQPLKTFSRGSMMLLIVTLLLAGVVACDLAMEMNILSSTSEYLLRSNVSELGNYTNDTEELVVKFWEYDKKTKPDSNLPVLALTILSIAVNSATCERLFSELSLIHTPKRNRLGTDKAMKLQILRQHIREKNRSEKVLPSSSNKFLRTIDARERPRIATPQNLGRAPPQTTNIVASTPARQLQNGRETPDHQLQGGCTTPSAVRNLFAEQPGVGTQSLGRGSRNNEFETPERRPSQPNSSQCNTSAAHTIFCANAGNGYLVAVGEGGVVARNLVAEFDGLLSTTELDEYLEEFVWEEFGDDGDEETDGVWDVS